MISGYGNISPKTDLGKLVTIVYAIIGMPLFLLYLSNIGDILAKSFKWVYASFCLCRCRGAAHRRALRERLKTRDSVPYDPNWTEFDGVNNGMGWNDNINDDDTEESSHGDGNYIDAMSEESESNGDFGENSSEITVPLTVSLAIMISYIIFGAVLFANWEGWNPLDGSYFCFISLSSIGFGDLVPGFEVSFVFYSFYVELNFNTLLYHYFTF